MCESCSERLVAVLGPQLRGFRSLKKEIREGKKLVRGRVQSRERRRRRRGEGQEGKRIIYRT